MGCPPDWYLRSMTSGRWIAAPPRHHRSFAAARGARLRGVGLAACGPTRHPTRSPSGRRRHRVPRRLPAARPPPPRAPPRRQARRVPAPRPRPADDRAAHLLRARREARRRPPRLPADATSSPRARVAAGGAERGQTDAGLSTAIPDLNRVRSTGLMGDVLVVNLSGSFSALGPQFSSELRVAQIGYTVSVFPVKVLFQIDGQPARAIGGFILPGPPESPATTSRRGRRRPRRTRQGPTRTGGAHDAKSSRVAQAHQEDEPADS